MFPLCRARVDTGRPEVPFRSGCRGFLGLVPQPLCMKSKVCSEEQTSRILLAKTGSRQEGSQKGAAVRVVELVTQIARSFCASRPLRPRRSVGRRRSYPGPVLLRWPAASFRNPASPRVGRRRIRLGYMCLQLPFGRPRWSFELSVCNINWGPKEALKASKAEARFSLVMGRSMIANPGTKI
jgi:hypothetical protein